MTWTEQLRAAEDALQEQLRAARELESGLHDGQLEPGQPGWMWFRRARFRERWAREPWSSMVWPSPGTGIALGWTGLGVGLCMGAPLADLVHWVALFPAMALGVFSGLLLATGVAWLRGRQVLVRGAEAAALVQVRLGGGGARVCSVQDFDSHGARLPLNPGQLLSEEALQALEGSEASREVLEELALVVRLVQTRSAQLLDVDQRLKGEARERALVWWHELHDSLERALALLGSEPERGLAALRYLLLQVGPQLDQALKTRRLPELPPPSDWASVGDARAPAELLELARDD